MSVKNFVTLDGNEAVASVAHRTSELIVIYPITPSSPMGEFSDEWSAAGKKNIWGNVPHVQQMQSEAGAIGAVHGAVMAGTLATTFTSSQGLLLMIPNMFKLAGELSCFVMHVAARTVATHALSIFGDHSDVMACRSTGFAMLSSNSVQEAHDMALIATAATLQARVPFVHFFDGFRTSHEVSTISPLPDDVLKAMIPDELVTRMRARSLSPDKPTIRGTAQNPDTFFQAREACNPFYDTVPFIVSEQMAKFAQLTGRTYKLYEYIGHPEAEHVIVAMGSGCETIEQTIDALQAEHKGNAKIGLLKVRMYRPFAVSDFIHALPSTTKRIAVLDRTKEPGAAGEPLYQDTVTALFQASQAGVLHMGQVPLVIRGRYGISSKEFTPAMVKAVYDELVKEHPQSEFTVGINDDITRLSLKYDPNYSTEGSDVTRAVFFGLGSDGTVGANKNSIKIIGDETDLFGQGYFVYDSKKSGTMTISHLRFGPKMIRSPYLISQANFVACHQFQFASQKEMLDVAANGAVFLINAPFGAEEVWDHLPVEAQREVINRKLKLYTIDAVKVAKNAGMGGRINTIMQTCFFAISGILPKDEAIAKIKKAIEKTYGRRGQDVVQKNYAAVDAALANLFEVKVPAQVTAKEHRIPPVPAIAPDFVQRVTGIMLEGHGDVLPVSAFAPDGVWPVGTTKFEKRNIAQEIPVWDASICIQCNKCALVCPHAAIRPKAVSLDQLKDAPASFKHTPGKSADIKGLEYLLQVAPEDCTGCSLCVEICPAKDKANPEHKALNMENQAPIRTQEAANFEYFLKLPDYDRTKLTRLDARGTQFMQPLFEFSGACSGCGETPYIKLVSQLFGDRTLIANATGCSSIFGGNLPTCPYTTNDEGRGPAWANSLFEDNAEFGLGIFLATAKRQQYATELVKQLSVQIGEELTKELLEANQDNEAGIAKQRARVAEMKKKLKLIDSPLVKRLEAVADNLVKKSIWIIGGDGWAYDIGYGGLDHVLSLPYKVNILVLDTEVYSNTGGQASKSTPLSAAAKFAAAGKATAKKDLGLMIMSYGHAYVASIAMGANDNHAVKAIAEAEAYPGPSLVIAYSHCGAHGIDMVSGLSHQKMAVESGVWPLYRFDPRRAAQGLPALQLDNPAPKMKPEEFFATETRFKTGEKVNPERYKELAAQAAAFVEKRQNMYKQLATVQFPTK